MASSMKMTLAFIIMAMFVMMMLIPAVPASLSFWTLFATLLVVVTAVPLALWFALRKTRREVETYEGDLLDWRGYNAEEWAEERDPDDFEGEMD
jgi:membrane protein implicated in regulation of membrane protease activity